MSKYYYFSLFLLLIFSFISTTNAELKLDRVKSWAQIKRTAQPCAFDKSKSCTLQRDILNDIGTNGLRYYASTNYDHRQSSEINVYRVEHTNPYSDNVNAPGQLRMTAVPNPGGDPKWFSGEIMTRRDLEKNPWNSPVKSNPWTTKDPGPHGYLEVIVKNAKCEQSDDGLCPNNAEYNKGLWPAIWLEPWYDADWPLNGEIDLMEAYMNNIDFSRSDTTIHFFGNSKDCQAGDCVHHGYHVSSQYSTGPQYDAFHIWGFEWEPDPNSKRGGVLLTGYFDNVKNWGPLASDKLPADGGNALLRGFNDREGGYYLIVNLAIGSAATGPINSHVKLAAMYLQSAKAYTVDGSSPPPPPPPGGNCKPPINIQAMWSPDKKQIILGWQDPSGSDPIKYYEIHDWQDKFMWKGSSQKDHCMSDQTLPGTPGNFDYYLYTVCNSSTSTKTKYTVHIP